jgi:hypothetical protein
MCGTERRQIGKAVGMVTGLLMKDICRTDEKMQVTLNGVSDILMPPDLNRRSQQRHQDADDCDDNHQLNQGEAITIACLGPQGCASFPAARCGCG